MILTGPEITRAQLRGDVTISPFSPSQVNPNSYDYRLSPELVELSPLDDRRVLTPAQEPVAVANRQELPIPDEGLVLQPGRLYLGTTFETLGSRDFVTTLIGKSSMGRLGLFLQVDACLGHRGVAHRWTLELCVRQPLKVYPMQVVGQVSFWHTVGDVVPYEGFYGRVDAPSPNRENAYGSRSA